jgi:archaellum component FlaC
MKFLDDYFGEPARPGVPERPGVMARLQRVEDLAREIRNETTTNGGTSMKDEIRRTASQVGTIRSKVEQLAGRVEQIDLDREHREHPAP